MEILFFNKKTEKLSKSLDEKERAKLDQLFILLETYGNSLGMPYSKALGKGLFELRLVGEIHVRFIYTFYESTAWILHGFVKKTNQIPKGDLQYARKQLKNLLR